MNVSSILGSTARADIALIGVGEFGSTLISLAIRNVQVGLRVVCDLDVERAAKTLIAAGFREDQLAVCDSREAGLRAWESERIAIFEDSLLAVQMPVAAVIEATGRPLAAAATARASLLAGKHLVLATKELEGIAGPILGRMAQSNGCVHTLADGDQPSLLVGLIGWAELQGFEVIAAGKSTSARNDVVWVPEDGRLQYGGNWFDAPDFAEHFVPITKDARARIDARRVAGPDVHPIVDDLCEIAIIANHTSLSPDGSNLRAPLARPVELPTLFRPASDGGLFSREGVVDMFRGLRMRGELPFAGGVFVTVRTPDVEFGRKFARIGIPTSEDGSSMMLHNPLHLLGAEAVLSALSATRLGKATGSARSTPRFDLVARAERDFRSGDRISLVGETDPAASSNVRHSIDGLAGELIAAGPLADNAPVPYYLAIGRDIVRPVRKGELLRGADLAAAHDSALMTLRREQDHNFFGHTTASGTKVSDVVR